MLTPENIVLFFVAIGVSLTVAVGYDRLRPNRTMSREDHLEEEIKRLTARVEALQETIDLLSGRVVALQRENERLKNELTRLVPFGTWRVTETTELRRALERLTEDEFRSLAFENFQSVYDGFDSNQTLHAKRLALLDYAEKQGKLEVLRSAILAINPVAFG